MSQDYKDGNSIKASQPSDFIPTEAAATMLHLSPRTLIRWRDLRKGPTYIKAGRRVLYRVTDIELWLEKNKVQMVGEGA